MPKSLDQIFGPVNTSQPQPRKSLDEIFNPPKPVVTQAVVPQPKQYNTGVLGAINRAGNKITNSGPGQVLGGIGSFTSKLFPVTKPYELVRGVIDTLKSPELKYLNWGPGEVLKAVTSSGVDMAKSATGALASVPDAIKVITTNGKYIPKDEYNLPALGKVPSVFGVTKNLVKQEGTITGTTEGILNAAANVLIFKSALELPGQVYNKITSTIPDPIVRARYLASLYSKEPGAISSEAIASAVAQSALQLEAPTKQGGAGRTDLANIVRNVNVDNATNIAEAENAVRAALKKAGATPEQIDLGSRYFRSMEQVRNFGVTETPEPTVQNLSPNRQLTGKPATEPVLVRDVSQMTPEEQLRSGIQPKVKPIEDIIKVTEDIKPTEKSPVVDIRPGETPPPEPGTPRFAPSVPATGKVNPRQITVDRFVLDEPQLAKLNERIQTLGLDTKQIQTSADVARAAAELGTDPATLIKGFNKQTLNSAQVKAITDEVNQTSQRMAQTEKKLSDPGIVDAEKKVLEAQLHQDELMMNALLNKQIKGLSETARALNTAKQLANQTLDPAVWYGRAKRFLGNQEFTSEIRTTIDQIIQSGDRLALAKFVTSLKKPSLLTKAITAWKTGLLSNPGTDIANLGGNVFMRVMETGKNVPAFIIDRMAGYLSALIKGGKPQFTKANPLSTKVLGEQLSGLFGSGPKRAAEYLKTGRDFEDAAAKWDANTNVTFDTPVLQKLIDLRFRTLQAEDLLFREPALRGSIAEQAIVLARNKGLKGAELAKFIDESIKKPTPKMIEIARNDAKYSTFQQENPVASWLGQGIKRNAGLQTTIETTAPFRRTIFNIFDTVIDYSPFGMPKTVFKTLSDIYKGKGFDQKYFVEGLGRSVTGSSIIAAGWALTRKGMAVGSYPKDEAQRNALVARNIQPYSVQVPGTNTWVRLDRFQPFATLFFAGVDAATAWSQPGTTLNDKLAQISFGAIRTYGQSPYMQGFSRFANAITNPENYGGSFVEQFVGSFVPNMISSVARGSDKYQRDVSGLTDTLKSKIPGLRQTLPPSVNVYGKNIPGTKGVLGAIFSPVIITKESQDKNDQFIKKLGYGPSTPTPTITIQKGLKSEEIKLSGKEKENFLRDMGNATSQAISALSNSPQFFNLPEEVQKNIFNNIVGQYRSLVTQKYQAIYQNK